MQKNNLESDYRILEALKKNPNISQRDLAKELGYSLGKVNYLLEALFNRGLVKMDNFIKSNNKIGYMYILTPKGISERAKITKRFLNRKIKEHEMIQKEINVLREKLTSNLSYISLSIISLFPVIIFLGSGILNFSIILLDILFISEILLKKNFKYFNNKLFYSFIFCWLILLINLNFSISFYDSLPRSLGFLRFIFFVFAINYYLFETSNKNVKLIFKFWTIVFVIISVDLIYEYFVGVNTLGFKSYMPGRLSGFFGDELVAGYFLLGFSFISIAYLYEKTKIKVPSGDNYLGKFTPYVSENFLKQNKYLLK